MGDITSNLFLQWRFLEGSGTTVADSTGNGHGLTLTNGPTWGAGPFTGLPEISFDGSNDYAQSTASLDLSGTNVITVATWLKWPSSPPLKVYWESSANYNNFSDTFACFQVDNNSKLSFDHKGNVGYCLSNLNTQPSAATWHHFAVIYDFSLSTNEVYAYVDGSLATMQYSTNANNTGNFGNRVLNLASRNGASVFAQVEMADFRIYTRALASGDVTDLFAYRGTNRRRRVLMGAA